MAVIERTKNTVTGAIWGILEKVVSIMLPFIVRTVLIRKLGSEYLGLSGLFSSILQVINLTELGFGAASVFAMYKPIAEDDYYTTGAILTYLRKIYKLIGLLTIGIGIISMPFLKYMISGDVPSDINIYILYIIYIANTAVSYLLFAHKRSLLSALQLNSIINKLAFMTNIALYVSQILILFFVPNYYYYIIMLPLFTIISNVCCSVVVDKNYKQWLLYGTLDKSIKDDIKKRLFPLMSTKLAVVLVNAADTLVISAFLGLIEVAIYNNYYYIMNSISGFLLVIYGAMQAGIGNALVVDSSEKIMKDFKKFCFINNWIDTVCTVSLLCLYHPFMELWVGKDMMLSFGMVILFCVYFYTSNIWRVVIIYKDAAGIWREDMIRVYLGSALNLALNIGTIRYIGLYGVIGSSVASNILVVSWMGYILYKSVFQESSKEFYVTLLKDMFIAIIVCVCSYELCKICNLIDYKLLALFLKGFMCVVLSNAIMYFLYRRNPVYKNSVEWIKSKLKIAS